MSKDNVHKILLFSASALAKNCKEILLQNENLYMLTIHYSNGIFLVKQFEVPLQISNTVSVFRKGLQNICVFCIVCSCSKLKRNYGLGIGKDLQLKSETLSLN